MLLVLAACCTVTFHVHVPAGTPAVYLTGNLGELGPWHPDGKRLSGEGQSREARVEATPDSAFKYKFTLGSWDRQALNPDGTIPDDSRLVVHADTTVSVEITRFKEAVDYLAEWRGSGVLGTLVYWRDVHSAFLGPDRNVEIWLPPGYDSATSTRYPVLYMADGQNLFDPRLSYTGVDWGVDESVMRLVQRGVIPPIIVVGVWNSTRRSFEYSPWHGAPQYARFLIEELMPRVNREFRTLTGPANTATMGSSMGGILSFYLVTYHPDVFGSCGCISTPFLLSEAWDQRMFGGPASAQPDTVPHIVHDIAGGLKPPHGARYWFDYGTIGIDSTFGPTEEIARRWLLRSGLVEGKDFVMRRYEGATHNEAAWRARLDDPLTFLFGRR